MKKIKKMFKKLFRLRKRILNIWKNIVYTNYYYNYDIKKNTVLIESKNGSDLASNMFYILQETVLNYPDHCVFISVLKRNEKLISEKLKFYGLYEKVILVKKNSFKYYN